MASPANTKLGLRMTTLHEEPTKSLPRKHSFDLLTDDTIEEQTEEGQNGKSEVHVSSKQILNEKQKFDCLEFTVYTEEEEYFKKNSPNFTHFGLSH